MKTIIRIEHSSGWGIFRAHDGDYNVIAKQFTFWEDLLEKHRDFPTPSNDDLIDRWIEDYEFCAFKSIEQIHNWFDKEWFSEMTTLGFKVLMLDVSECIIGEYQVLYKKENVLQSKDITNLFL
jgi:hypothetical protein